MKKKNPINESGERYEALAASAFELAKVAATPRKRFTIDGKLLPGQKWVVVDYFIQDGQLEQYDHPIIVSIKGLSGYGSEQTKLLVHIDREIPSYPFPTVLVMLGDGWTPEYIQEARNKVNGQHFLAVLTSADELMLWLQRARGNRSLNFGKRPKTRNLWSMIGSLF